MIDFGVGFTTANTYAVKKLDLDLLRRRMTAIAVKEIIWT